MAKNVLQKHWDGVKWIEIHPITKASNVINADGSSVEQKLGTKADKANVPDKTVQSTSTGRWWSRTKENLVATLDGQQHHVSIQPRSYKERVLFIGSSSTAGNGAVNIENQYFNIIKRRVGEDHYDWFFHGIGGDDTSDVINRFYNDVAPFQPHFVVLQLTLGNEGLYTASIRNTIYRQFRDNMLQLIRMVEQLGAIPIVIGQCCTQRFTESSRYYQLAMQMNMEIAQKGVHVIDWMGQIADDNGNPLSGLMKDTLHYNDAGQRMLAGGFPNTFLKCAKARYGGILPRYDGHVRINGAPTAMTPMFFIPDPADAIPNYSVFFRVKYAQPGGAVGMVSFNDIFRIFVNGTTQNRIFMHNGTDSTSADTNDVGWNKWMSIGFTYHEHAKVAILYVNGIEVLRRTNQTVPLERLALGGRETTYAGLGNSEWKDLLLYRTRLSKEQMKQLHEGVYHQSSLELYCPLNDKLVQAYMPFTNLAPTLSDLVVNANENNLVPS